MNDSAKNTVRQMFDLLRESVKIDDRTNVDTSEIDAYIRRLRANAELSRRERAEDRLALQIKALRHAGWTLRDRYGEARTDGAFYALPGPLYRIVWDSMPDEGPYLMHTTEDGDILVSHISGEVVPLVYLMHRQGAASGRSLMVLEKF